MSRVLRPNYDQRFLLPPALDEWVPRNHPVRFVRDFVDALDLADVGIHQPTAKEGRPPFAPDLLLKVWLFGYMERIRSTRALEKACVQVMPFLWLTGLLQPDHNTLWRFFNKNRKALPQLFKTLVKAAAEEGLVGFVLHALDGTKLAAASSTDEALHRKALVERLKRLDEFVEMYVKEVSSRSEDDKGTNYLMPDAMANEDVRRARIRALLERRIEDRQDAQMLAGVEEQAAHSAKQMSIEQTGAKAVPTVEEGKDEPPPGAGAPPSTPSSSLESPADPVLREAKSLREELVAKLAKLDEMGIDHLHEAEPEARMVKGRGSPAIGYNAQVVVDHDSDMIVACEVTPAQNDIGQLVPMLSEVRQTLGRVAEQTVADNGYVSGEQLKSAEDQQMPVLVTLREEPDVTGPYAKRNFHFDVESNVYICPQGERLVQIGKNKSHASAKEPDTIYGCKNKTCPVRAQCTTHPRGRQIRRPYGEDATERQAQKQADPRMRTLLGLRKEIVEHLFGIVKTIDGFRRLTVRGLENARAQWSLVCTAVNLRKLAAMATCTSGKLVPVATAPNTAG